MTRRSCLMRLASGGCTSCTRGSGVNGRQVGLPSSGISPCRRGSQGTSHVHGRSRGSSSRGRKGCSGGGGEAGTGGSAARMAEVLKEVCQGVQAAGLLFTLNREWGVVVV